MIRYILEKQYHTWQFGRFYLQVLLLDYFCLGAFLITKKPFTDSLFMLGLDLGLLGFRLELDGGVEK